jgi:isoleucyl-tRNA synthetase
MLVLNNPGDKAKLEKYRDVIIEELNIKGIEYIDRAEEYVEFTLRPDFAKLGPRLGKLMPKVKAALGAGDTVEMIRRFKVDGKLSLDIDGAKVDIMPDEANITISPKAGYAAAHDAWFVLILNTELTKELIREGLAREFVHKIQNMRKDADLDYQARIEIVFNTDEYLSAAVAVFTDYIMKETLAVRLDEVSVDEVEGEFTSDDMIARHPVNVAFKVFSGTVPK